MSDKPKNKLTAALQFPLPYILLAVLGLLVGLHGGLVRLGWPWGLPQRNWMIDHGPLMVLVFMASVIGVERAVASRRTWSFLAPATLGIGGILIMVGAPAQQAAVLTTLGAALYCLVVVGVYQSQKALYTVMMLLAAVALFIGSGLWLAGVAIPHLVEWWTAYLILTIAGERLALGRLFGFSRLVKTWFSLASGLILLGPAINLWQPTWGIPLGGLGMIMLAVWLFRYDVARRFWSQPQYAGFSARALLAGYFWLLIAGALRIWLGPQAAGNYYDAQLHAVFLGMTFSMIFGHGPLIFPALLRRKIDFPRGLYLPLFLLHIGLLIRVIGDLIPLLAWRHWGGLINALAIVLFFLILMPKVLRGEKLSETTLPLGW